MDLTSGPNAWVDSYLDALLSTGLSSEHVRQAREEKEVSAGDADANIAARYFVNQILNLDEDAIQQAWLKVSHNSNVRLAGERDARLQYLSWRVWGMKRKHALVLQQRAREPADLDDDELSSDARSSSDEQHAGGSGGGGGGGGGRRGPVDEEDLVRLYGASAAAAAAAAAGTAGGGAAAADAAAAGAAPPLLALSLRSLRKSSRAGGAGGGASAALLAAAPGLDVTDDGDGAGASPVAPASPLYAAATDALAGSLAAGAARVPKLYCVLVSMHGLVRGDAMELGKDPDTGGQVKYVVELAKALSRHPAVHRVDLLTRLVRDPEVDVASYGRLEEPLTERAGELGGAYIARIPCGPVATYLRKEMLWPYIREFADNALSYVTGMMARLAAAGEPCELYDVHGHYADAGEAAALMSFTLGVDMVLTGHSLGRNKLDHLLKSAEKLPQQRQPKLPPPLPRPSLLTAPCPSPLYNNTIKPPPPTGTMSRAEIEASYAIGRRIEAEERALDAALVVFTSTQQEVRDQWGLYDGYNEDLQRVVRARLRRGRHFAVMRVVPPGLDFSNLKITPPPDPWDALAGGGCSTGALLRPAGSSGGGGGNGGPAAAAGPGLSKGLRRSSASSSWATLPPAAVALGSAVADAGGDAATTATSTTGGGASAADLAAALSSPRLSGPGGGGGGGLGSPRTPASGSGLPFAADALARPAPMSLEDPPIWRAIFRFLRNPRKPVILAMSRPDAKKNITTLVRAYGSCGPLREIANLVLIMGNREVIDGMAPGSAKVLEQVLKLIDAYDLYGSVAYPKRHSQDDISDIYLLPAATRGVFVNIALQEPFGLTLIEAAAHGVPIVATTNGGPVDIVHTLRNGLLVEPNDAAAVSAALLSLLTNAAAWDEAAASGVANINAYSWSAHCVKCLNAIEHEKANTAKRTKHAQLRSNFSASLDDFAFNAVSGSFTSPPPGAAAAAAAAADGSGDNGLAAASGGTFTDADGLVFASGPERSSASLPNVLSPRAATAAVGHSFTTDDVPSACEAGGHDLTLTINSAAGFAPSSPRAGGGNSNSGSGGGFNGSSSSESPRAGGGGGGLQPRASSSGADRPLASTSVPLTGAYGGAAELPPHAAVQAANAPLAGLHASMAAALAMSGGPHMGAVRDKYVVFVLDSADTVVRLSRLLARKGKALMGLAAAGHSVGLGVATAFSLADTTDLLRRAGLSLSDLDFAVTNGGSEVWYCGTAVTRASAATSANSGGGDAVLDEHYDHLLDRDWDLVSVRRVLAQCMSERNFLTGAAAAAAAAGGAAAAAAPISSLGRTSLDLRGGAAAGAAAAGRPRIRVDSSSGAHHLVVTLRTGDTPAPAGPLSPPPGSSGSSSAAEPTMTAAEQLALIARIKRRFRKSGLRTQVVAQMDGNAIRLHITPLRGSRALALRHLTHKHRVDMTSLVLVTCARDLAPTPAGGGLHGSLAAMAAAGATAGAAGVARFACSDLEDLVAGVQGVLVVPPPPAGSAAAAAADGQDGGVPPAVARDGFPVDLSLFTHDGRVQLLHGFK